MKDLQNKMEEPALESFSGLNTINILTDTGYVVIFQHPVSGDMIFLANCADIKAICYSKHPKLPGTQNLRKAKIYQCLEDAKKDMYLLRYHHRQFLQVNIFAKKVLYLKAGYAVKATEDQITYYPLKELILKDN